jgi:hypothetical protein
MHACLPCTQYTAYESGLDEPVVANLLDLPRDIRQNAHQRPRPNGRFANPGGFVKRAKKVFKKSGGNPYFYPGNVNGAPILSCMHACMQHSS